MQRGKIRLFLLIGGIATLLAPPLVSAQTAGGTAPKQSEEDVQKQAEESKRAQDIFLREQLVLFQQGELQLEFGTVYTQETREQFGLLNNVVMPAKITVNSVNPILTLRYNLIDNLELDVNIPFVAVRRQIDFGVTRIHTDEQGLGDISGALRYQLWYERGARPSVILDVNGKTHTGDIGPLHTGDGTLIGTGHWNVGAGITLVKTVDPVVFFGRLGYTYTIERNGVDPGDEIAYRMGMGFSLNDRVSFNMQVLGTYVEPVELNGAKITDSSLNIISLQFGVTVLLAKHLFIEPSVNMGLTDDAADVGVGLSVPFQF
jgi:hypothetical protein